MDTCPGREDRMNDNPTLREVYEAFRAWLMAYYQMFQAWLDSLWDIRIGTLFQVFFIVLALVFLVGVLTWLVRVSDLTMQYRALGYSWLRALRLAQADLED